MRLSTQKIYCQATNWQKSFVKWYVGQDMLPVIACEYVTWQTSFGKEEKVTIFMSYMWGIFMVPQLNVLWGEGVNIFEISQYNCGLRVIKNIYVTCAIILTFWPLAFSLRTTKV